MSLHRGDRFSPLLLTYGTPVEPGRCPRVLLRFSGPCGVRDFLEERMTRLAPVEDAVVFMASRKVAFISTGVDYFGCFAVFNPDSFQLVQTRDPDVFVGLNRRLENPHDVAWISPGVMNSVLNWADFDTREKVDALMAPTVAADRRAVLERLKSYFEELSDLVNSGFQAETAFWFKRPIARRLEILRIAGIERRWSDANYAASASSKRI